jgi:hypothetical protein
VRLYSNKKELKTMATKYKQWIENLFDGQEPDDDDIEDLVMAISKDISKRIFKDVDKVLKPLLDDDTEKIPDKYWEIVKNAEFPDYAYIDLAIKDLKEKYASLLPTLKRRVSEKVS